MEPLEFSENLRRVLETARAEATRLGHPHIGTEHLLMALVRNADAQSDTTDTVAVAFDLLGLDRAKLRVILEQTVLRGDSSETSITYTSSAKGVLELALAEARVLKHDAVRPEHLLLGLVREVRGVACQILLDQGVTVDKVRAVLARLS